MKKKTLFTLLLALFVIASGQAQKKHTSYYCCNVKHGQYSSNDCHPNGRGHGSDHCGKHKKHKKHKHKHHDWDDRDDYGHRHGGCKDRDYGHKKHGDQCGAGNGRNRNKDRDDNWGNSNPQPRPVTRPGRNTPPIAKSEQIPAPRHTNIGTGNMVKKPVYNLKAPAKTVKVAKRSTSRSAGSTMPAQRASRPGN